MTSGQLTRLITAAISLLLSITAFADAPTTFTAAKVVAKQEIFFDQAQSDDGELYCGCKWEWVGKSCGRIDPKSCGYEPRKQQTRADRIEWEHIVPAWVFGHQRQRWQNGGRKNCVADDPVFRAMEADLFNLYPSVGEVNGDRSNFQYGMVRSAPPYGACSTRIDFSGKAAEPRDEVKGLVARSTFYMYDRYGLSMSRQQQQVLMAWNRQYPVTTSEKRWESRTATVMGRNNPFVTGERSWTLGHKPLRDGLVSQLPAPHAAPASSHPSAASFGSIIGDRNSNVYHLPQGCPSYNRVATKNRVPFNSEAEAQAAGYRKARNCR
ncbi:endonuclease [Pseudomonas aeruginosa]|uniref:endonuclease n=1 Tax=Pseudomonas aeruginosa TaxID=287 RepID=UPI000FC40BB2|nr:endonuclease [Pseudomonas aeruginosa]RUF61058.1 deoxyribonuclease I [Pseudomonas aeruginosa]